MDPTAIGRALEALASHDVAKRKSRHLQTLRGLRGVSDGDVARLATSTWLESPPALPADADALTTLFTAAHEDGLVAIGLLGALVPDAPSDALDLGLDWLSRVDDLQTADALGPVVLGPAALSTGRLDEVLAAGQRLPRAEARRAVVLAALAATPEPLAGPAAAPLRARLDTRTICIVAAPLAPVLAETLPRFLRDPAPSVQKALRHVLRAWRRHDKEAATHWADTEPGGIPKTLRAELSASTKSRKKK